MRKFKAQNTNEMHYLQKLLKSQKRVRRPFKTQYLLVAGQSTSKRPEPGNKYKDKIPNSVARYLAAQIAARERQSSPKVARVLKAQSSAPCVRNSPKCGLSDHSAEYIQRK